MRLLPCLLMLLGACDGDTTDVVPDDTDVAAPTFTRLQANVLVPSCGGGGCHDATSQRGDLNLEALDAYEALLDAPCDNPQAVVEGLVRVSPGSLEDSYLWIKLTDPRGMGDVMPPFGALDDDELDQIKRWILSGAPR